MNRRNFKKLSNTTGIPEWQFKVTAGQPLEDCLANSVPEAMEKYFAAPDGSEEQEAALALWVELSTTVIEIKAAYEAGCGDSPAKKIALMKWQDMVRTLCENATTLCRAMKLLQSSPGCSTKNQKVKFARLIKKDAKVLVEVPKATTLSELIAIHKSAPIGGKAREAILVRMIELFEG